MSPGYTPTTSLYSGRPNCWTHNDADVLAAQALADVATIAVLHDRGVRDTQVVNEQLHHALNSRVVIEQAKGMVAEAAGIDMDQAFSRLRHHARSHNLRLVDLAHGVIARATAVGSLDVAPVGVAGPRAPVAKAPATPGGIEPLLDMVEAAAPVDAVEVVVGGLAAMLGADEVTFLIVDLDGDSLVRFVRPSERGQREAGAAQRVEAAAMAGTPYRAALVSQDVQVVADGGRYRVFAPVTERGDALGVIELVLGSRPDDALVREVSSAAHALAYVLIASRRHTDRYECVQRSASFSLAAEIQRRVLPPAFTCEAEQFTFAGWLEPASHVGGDTFDYSVDRDVLHVSMTDAMGHGVKAALLATIALASLRNSRRGDVGLAEQARRANEAMMAYAQDDQFVTGLLLQADLHSGRVMAVNAGHPRPYRLRRGQVDCLDLDADIPFGMMGGSSYSGQELHLEPGDRLVVVTDGFLERNASSSTHLDVAAAVAETAALHPREVVHVFKASVLAATGAKLADDAAVLCIDWHGSAGTAHGGRPSGTGRRRVTSATAEGRAETPDPA